LSGLAPASRRASTPPPSSPGAALRDPAVADARRARRARPLRRRPVPAAARRLDEEHVARPDDDADLLRFQGPRRPAAREEPVAMREPVLAAEQPVGRVAHAVARGVGAGGLLGGPSQA